jgi:hypothetical protein
VLGGQVVNQIAVLIAHWATYCSAPASTSA